MSFEQCEREKSEDVRFLALNDGLMTFAKVGSIRKRHKWV